MIVSVLFLVMFFIRMPEDLLSVKRKEREEVETQGKGMGGGRN